MRFFRLAKCQLHTHVTRFIPLRNFSELNSQEVEVLLRKLGTMESSNVKGNNALPLFLIVAECKMSNPQFRLGRVYSVYSCCGPPFPAR